jgi:tetratricopeptide (TPR) repeat protein
MQKAHFQLGKLYYYELKDYQAAGYHFKTCAELEPSFPDVYYHYLHLVVFLNMKTKMNEVADKALVTPGVDAASVYYLQGLFNEKNKNWANALQAYRNALMETTCRKQNADIEEGVARVKSKIQQSNTYHYYLQD